MAMLIPESREGKKDFFDEYVVTYFDEQFPDAETIDRCEDWTLSN